MIRQIQAVHPLPDWRNLGVVLRVLLGGNALALGAALALDLMEELENLRAQIKTGNI